MIRWLFRRYCGWSTGHYLIKTVDNTQRRIFMECLHCGYQPKGFTLSGSPRQRFEGDKARHQMRMTQ